jgi:hypothetical protein
MHRPKRACTERAQEKIREILEWEACTEDSQMFKAVEAQMEQELDAEVRTRDYAPSSASESDSHSEVDDACSEDEECSQDEEDEEDEEGEECEECEECEADEKKEEPFDPSADD